MSSYHESKPLDVHEHKSMTFILVNDTAPTAPGGLTKGPMVLTVVHNASGDRTVPGGTHDGRLDNPRDLRTTRYKMMRNDDKSASMWNCNIREVVEEVSGSKYPSPTETWRADDNAYELRGSATWRFLTATGRVCVENDVASMGVADLKRHIAYLLQTLGASRADVLRGIVTDDILYESDTESAVSKIIANILLDEWSDPVIRTGLLYIVDPRWGDDKPNVCEAHFNMFDKHRRVMMRYRIYWMDYTQRLRARGVTYTQLEAMMRECLRENERRQHVVASATTTLETSDAQFMTMREFCACGNIDIDKLRGIARMPKETRPATGDMPDLIARDAPTTDMDNPLYHVLVRIVLHPTFWNFVFNKMPFLRSNLATSATWDMLHDARRPTSRMNDQQRPCGSDDDTEWTKVDLRQKPLRRSARVHIHVRARL